MKREDDVISFEPDDGDALVKFEKGIAGKDGAKFLMESLLQAMHRASGDGQRAWRDVQAMARAAGLLNDDEWLAYSWETESFTVHAGKPDPAGDSHLQNIAMALGQAKVAAVGKKDFVRAAAIRDVGESLQKVLRAKPEPQAEETMGAEELERLVSVGLKAWNPHQHMSDPDAANMAIHNASPHNAPRARIAYAEMIARIAEGKRAHLTDTQIQDGVTA